MATLTLKNVPEDVYLRLKRQAAANRRSLNQEAIHVLASGVGPARHTDEILADIDALHDRLAAKGVWVTPEEVERWINEGRE